MSGAEPTGARRRSRQRIHDKARMAKPHQAILAQPQLIYEPVRIVSDDQLQAIHETSLTILAEIGMDVLHEEARALFGKAGAIVKGERVRLGPEIIDAAVQSSPESFLLHARNPQRNLTIGDGRVAFSAVASAPNGADRSGGRRPGNQVDFQNLVRLSQSLPAIHLHGGYPVEPVDIHAGIRHLVCLRDIVHLSDKPLHAYSLGAMRNRDAIEITRIARQVSNEQLDREPSLITIINTSSPLRLDTPMAQGIIEMSARGQIVCVTPFTLAGAMAPVTIAGAVTQQNAEALLGLTLTQLVKPGAPFIYGGFTSNVDMRSGAPAFGTPEYMKAALLGGQLARLYRVPYRSSNVCAANTVDAQAAYESVFSLWGAIMGGANLIKHAAGWMEGGLQANFEKMVIDADLLAMVAEFLTPLETDKAALALDAVREVGPGGHFFGAAHTQARYRTAFFAPMISDWRNYESWQEAGSPDAHAKAESIVRQLLYAFEPPHLEAGVKAELDAFVDHRIAEGGVATDF